eukprot:TRINITY_DN19932_c0_g1_i2.p2 TRINITY_DN19932_c0_g1~~TRINITY_DN19932_c0_g1_i2.p2  ORF type:complete len:133 (+),score=21.15 TRINITY_DN19932_c0_g1_i2:68-466(+)
MEEWEKWLADNVSSEKFGAWTSETREETLHNGLGEGPATVQFWTTAAGDRLEVWFGTEGEIDGDGFIVLETATGRALIVGCACAHPYISCNLFLFGNSDGSSDWKPPTALTSDSVLQHLSRIAMEYAFEQVH